MSNVDQFFNGYGELRSISGSLKALARAFEMTGNTTMQEELLCFSEDIMSAREQMYEAFQNAIRGISSVKENGSPSPNSSV